jgi:hypothetical protein
LDDKVQKEIEHMGAENKDRGLKNVSDIMEELDLELVE